MEFLDFHHPEWEQIWSDLAELPVNRGDALCESAGESWEYMGSTRDHHHLRHNRHPHTGQREFAYLERRCGINQFGYDTQSRGLSTLNGTEVSVA